MYSERRPGNPAPTARPAPAGVPDRALPSPQSNDGRPRQCRCNAPLHALRSIRNRFLLRSGLIRERLRPDRPAGAKAGSASAPLRKPPSPPLPGSSSVVHTAKGAAPGAKIAATACQATDYDAGLRERTPVSKAAERRFRQCSVSIAAGSCLYLNTNAKTTATTSAYPAKVSHECDHPTTCAAGVGCE